ncbi:hypothetical protein BGZ83_003060 [Gryganskiella cystojenkinii]|nr:hypothetical protein BGZ83_003060 [Gryganskiella cystojenkinii]
MVSPGNTLVISDNRGTLGQLNGNNTNHAAHVMLPFGGKGTNLASTDGVDLDRAIVNVVEDGEDLATVQKAIEYAMLARSKVAAFESAMGFQYMITEDNPKSAMMLFGQSE